MAMVARVTPSLLRRCFVALVVLATTITAMPAGTSHAIDGAAISSESTYRFDPDVPAVTVETTYRMTNQTPNRNVGGGAFEYYYFTGLVLPVAARANPTDLTVLVNGRDGTHTLDVDDEGFPYLEVDFGYQLRYGKTATVEVSYTLTGEPPRTVDTYTRVNDAYVSFPVYSWADDGAATVGIEVPADWTVDFVGGDLERVPFGDVTAYTASDFDTDEFFVWFTARDDDALVETELSVDAVEGGEFTIAAWPDDDEWESFVVDQITDGLPILVELTATPWPPSRSMTVREASTSYLRGYAGFHDVHMNEIEVGEELDAQTMQHELSHAWFNSRTLVDRFLVEGLAEEFAARTVERMGGELIDPPTDAEVRADWGDFAPFPLVEWFNDREQNDAEESYGYAASFRVMRALWDEIGEEQMRDVIRLVLGNQRAYPDDDGERNARPTVDWRNFYDVVEQETDAEAWRAVLVADVLDDDGIAELDERDDALERYDELVERGDGWWPTIDVRKEMAAWRFDAAVEAMDSALLVLDERDRLRVALEPIGLTEPTEFEDRYEEIIHDPRAEEIAVELTELAEDADRLASARLTLGERLDSIGQDTPELTQAEYDADPSGATEAAEEMVVHAEALSVLSGEVDELTEGSGLEVPPLTETVFSDDPAAAVEVAELRSTAVSAVLDARTANDDASSFVERVGRVGGDVDDDIASAETALADGRYGDAIESSDDAMAGIDELDDVGADRLTWAGVALLALVTLTAAGVVITRRRRSTDVASGEAADDRAADGSVDRQPDDETIDDDQSASATTR